MEPVAAVTKHFPKNKMKSPTLLRVAKSSALLIKVLNAWNKIKKTSKKTDCEQDYQCLTVVNQVEVDQRFRGVYCLHHQGNEYSSASIIAVMKRGSTHL
jgi:hypothetical protein